MAGRPSKRTPEREARLLEALRAGNTRRAASLYAGIDPSTLENWMLISSFSDAVKKAEADAEVRAVAQIAQAARDGTWQAAAWWLERRRFEDYSHRQRVELSIRAEAQRIADELGIDVGDVLREAEDILGSRR